MGQLSFDRNQDFVMEGYRRQRPFASFLPGLAGLHGAPLWAYYVNRGQCMSGFGIENKNKSIMEFFPATIAYQEAAFKGFRTFIRLNGGTVFEPFSDLQPNQPTETMTISPNALTLRSIDETAGLEVLVSYFTLSDERFASLCRRVEIRNLSDKPVELEALDGLAQLIPYGVGHVDLKTMGNLMIAWSDVSGLAEGPVFFRVRASTADTEDVEAVTGGHFACATVDGKKAAILADPTLVFGRNTTLSSPDAFARKTVAQLLAEPQVTVNRFPCAFTCAKASLKPGESCVVRSFIGSSDDTSLVLRRTEELYSPAYFEQKRARAAEIVPELTKSTACQTGIPAFDAYIRQCHLDNILRGGTPVFFDTKVGKTAFYVYSRKHGDLERDYNDFRLEPLPYSQGNGNFRDVCQNRRCDVRTFPETGASNIRLFLSLIQADGYNPLVIEGIRFTVERPAALRILTGEGVSERAVGRVAELAAKGFTPGAMYEKLCGILSGQRAQALLEALVAESSPEYCASFHEGYWIDHWDYCMDLIEDYLSVYPDKIESLLFGAKELTFFKSPARVRPRDEKTVLAATGVRRLGAVEVLGGEGGLMPGPDGTPYRTRLFEKLFLLALVKFATLDPLGAGIEMEAGKPGWNDSLNGLPALFGSGVGETAELLRLIRFLKSAPLREITIPGEAARLLVSVCDALHAIKGQSREDDYAFWDAISTARENYRAQIASGFTLPEQTLAASKLADCLARFEAKCEQGIGKARAIGGGIIPTFLSFEAERYEPLFNPDGSPKKGPSGHANVRVLAFKAKVMPDFLEGPVRVMRVEGRRQAEETYRAVRASSLYDRPLKMYKLSGPLSEMPAEAGRVSAFTPGWLENESVFLHMEYKYLLELLRAGLYEEFSSDFRDAAIPFLDPEMYGRSTLENCSFLASSANPDPYVRGGGFVARLSGSTVEMLNIWLLMTAGKQPFVMENGVLTLRIQPALPAWLFDESGKLSFTFLGRIRVTVNNPGRFDTWEQEAAVKRIALTFADGSAREVVGAAVTGEDALAVRGGKVTGIELFM